MAVSMTKCSGRWVGLPINVYLRAIDSRVEICRSEGECAIKRSGLLTVFAQRLVARRDLTQKNKILGIQFESSLQRSRRFCPATLPPIDITAPLECSCVVRQGPANNFYLSACAVVIQFAVEMPRPRKMRFWSIGL